MDDGFKTIRITMNIHFVTKLPDGGGLYCDYRGQKVDDPRWRSCDIRKTIRDHHDQWCDEIGKWHGNLSSIASRKTPWWWLAPASRIVIFYPPVFDPLLVAAGIAKFCEAAREGEKDLYLTGFPEKVAEYLRDLGSSLPHKIFREQKSARLPSRLVLFFRAAALFGARLASLIVHSQMYAFARPRISSQAKTLIYSHHLGGQNFEAFNDHFFHGILDCLPEFGEKDVVRLYLEEPGGFRSALSLRKFMKRKQPSPSVTVQSLIRLSDCLRIVGRHLLIHARLRKLRREMPILTVGGFQNRRFPFDYHRTMIMEPPLFTELCVYYAARRLWSRLKVDSLVYPYESKGIERALLKARNETAPQTKAIAYAHAIYNQGLLYVRHSHDELAGDLKPDLIACAGPRIRDWFARWGGVESERLTIIGSSRYGRPLPLQNNDAERGANFKVLFLGGLEHEFGGLAQWMENEPGIFENCHLTVRSYPYAWRSEQERHLSHIRFLCPNVTHDSRPLKQQLQECDVAVIGSTSAGVEAMLGGRPVVYADLHPIFDLDPFKNKGEFPGVLRCYSGRDLKAALHRLRSMEGQEFRQLVQAQTQLAEEIFSKPDPLQTSRILAFSRRAPMLDGPLPLLSAV